MEVAFKRVRKGWWCCPCDLMGMRAAVRCDPLRIACAASGARSTAIEMCDVFWWNRRASFFMQIADQEAAARVLARTALAVATDARTALAVATAEPAADPAARRKSRRCSAGVPPKPYASSKDAMSDSVRAALSPFAVFSLRRRFCFLAFFAAAHTSRACRSGCLRAVDRVCCV